MNIGFIAKLIAKDNFKKLGKGLFKVADSALVGGVVHNAMEEAEGHPKGHIDYYKLIGSLVPLFVLIAFLCGKITMEDVELLLKAF
jgi:hypothetical protein